MELFLIIIFLNSFKFIYQLFKYCYVEIQTYYFFFQIKPSMKNMLMFILLKFTHMVISQQNTYNLKKLKSSSDRGVILFGKYFCGFS